MFKRILATFFAAVAVFMFVVCNKEEKKPVAGNNGGETSECLFLRVL